MKIQKLVLFLLLIAPNITAAKDLGKIATSFKIEEEAFTVMMKRKLGMVDMEKERKKMEQIAKDRVENPNPVAGIICAEENRIFHFDPTYTLKEDVILPCGKILYKAGTMVNPLEHMDLNRRIFFVDAREETQVAWLKEQLNKQKTDLEDRVILIGGSVFDLKKNLQEQHKGKIYFDQNGEITTRFGIKHSPAIAQQEGLMIRIEEIRLEAN